MPDDARAGSLVDHSVHHHPQWREIPVDVEHAAWLRVNAELSPRPLLDELFQGSGPARKREEDLRELRHLFLALVHRGDDMDLAEVFVEQLLVDQERGDHADYVAPAFERLVGHHAHQTVLRAAVNDAMAFGHDDARGRPGLLLEYFSVPDSRAAIDADAQRLPPCCRQDAQRCGCNIHAVSDHKSRCHPLERRRRRPTTRWYLRQLR
jgi:hypothetical protein